MSAHADSTHSHVPKVGTLVAVWGSLIALTALTTFVSHLELGVFNIVVALLVAVGKASLVAWIFMGVRHTTSLTKLFVVAGLVWLSIMVLITFSDYHTRAWSYQAQPWSNTKAGGGSR
jgi:cytochrome c oxidase subunit 4